MWVQTRERVSLEENFSKIVVVNDIFKDNVEQKTISIPEENSDNKKKNSMINEAKKEMKKSIKEETLYLTDPV